MTKKILKIFVVICFVCALSLLITKIIKAKTTVDSKSINMLSSINPETNFFGQVDDKQKVEEILDASTILTDYKFVCENSSLALYIDEATMGIALYDKVAHYIWYSCYKNYKTSSYTDSIKQTLSSGIMLEVYDSSTLYETTKYSSNKKEVELKYDYLPNGFIVHANFITLAIKFDVLVTIGDASLNVEVLLDTLTEEKYQTKAMKYPKEYKVKAITIFPYFGSENYEINGYAFIPDGSGALIRYGDVEYPDTAYIKRVYGDDLGINPSIEKEYLKEQNNITLPIYGINHGYEQAAFLCEISNGYGSSELHSYPYMYGNINLNRTFFKFIARDKYNVKMASSESGNITLINNDIYSDKYQLTYTFLNGTNANYVGMAKKYQEGIDFKENNLNKAMKLDVVAQDYKKGLFGKNYITMTSYKDLLTILEDLANLGINDLEINFIGFNKNGYFDNTFTKFKLDHSLGSKKDYNALMDYVNNHQIKISYYNNPLVTKEKTLSKKTVKMQNLEMLQYSFKSSQELSGKVILPTKMSEYFLTNEKQFAKYGVKSFTFEYLGDAAFSYRYSGNNIVREKMIKEVVNEMAEIQNANQDYEFSLTRPNDYLFPYLSSYYNANHESSKYSFITDTIPFMSLVLSGNVKLYSSNVNYVSDYQLFNLRLVEFNIYPSFVITKEETNKLRYANYEYLYTTEYKLWKDQIVETYHFVNNALENVVNADMINHYYLASGISCTEYSNGVKIYVNYTEEFFDLGGQMVSPMNYLVVGGGM